jgi:hypothetical protein
MSAGRSDADVDVEEPCQFLLALESRHKPELTRDPEK